MATRDQILERVRQAQPQKFCEFEDCKAPSAGFVGRASKELCHFHRRIMLRHWSYIQRQNNPEADTPVPPTIPTAPENGGFDS